MRLREMAGSNERALLGGMGRIPDNSYQLDEDTKILQWCWDTSYIVGGWAPTYQRVGWGMWMPIGGFPPTLVRRAASSNGRSPRATPSPIAGRAAVCNTVTIHATPPPG